MTPLRRRDYLFLFVVSILSILALLGTAPTLITGFLAGLFLGLLLMYVELHGARLSPKSLSAFRE